MNYNLKNKAVAVIALAFMFTLTLNHASFAAEENAAAPTENVVPAPVPANPVDGLIQPVASAAEDAAAAINEVADTADKIADDVDNTAQKVQESAQNLANALQEKPVDAAQPTEEKPEAAPAEESAENLDFLNEQAPEDFLNSGDSLIEASDMSAPSEGGNPSIDSVQTENADTEVDPLSDAALDQGFDELKELDPVLPEAEAPKSPLEKFGNAILSKVDNNLFNQMSHIEKEATLLQLEKKREELRTKVLEERQKSLAIIEATRRAKLQLEEERKKAEAERQAKILEEQRKLKEREMELEKLRQGKVINDYMNEMLMMNQQWVEKSAKLQGRIKELEDERVDLIETVKAKIIDIDAEILKTHEHAVLVVKEHENVVSRFQKKIDDLQGTINDLNRELNASRQKIKEIQEAAENPFNQEAKDEGPNKNDVDMSKQYAIMDITGKGDDIVAKIINGEGKVFIVHKGSMLKNGEVVTSITDHYISFENKGVKSYLYTGNTIVEYEPEETFANTGEILTVKAPESDINEAVILNEQAAAKAKAEAKKALGKQTKPAKKNNNVRKPSAKTAAPSGTSTPNSPHVSAPSFGKGMFVR